jgi:hypothetical protein
MSLIRILNRSGQVTTAGPNSWATVGMWRRFFEMKEEEDEEQVDTFAEIMEGIVGGIDGARPIAGEEATQARREFVKEHYRNLTTVPEGITVNTTRQQMPSSETTASMREHEDQQLNRPNLDVPVDGSYVTLAQ